VTVKAMEDGSLTMEPRKDHADQFDEKERRYSGFMVTGMLMLAAAAMFSGLLAVTVAVIGGTLLGLAAYTVFHSDRADDRTPPAALPQCQRSEPQQAIHLEADAPPSARLWLERVELAADSQAAERGR
jgi:hypothetical protein